MKCIALTLYNDSELSNISLFNPPKTLIQLNFAIKFHKRKCLMEMSYRLWNYMSSYSSYSINLISFLMTLYLLNVQN